MAYDLLVKRGVGDLEEFAGACFGAFFGVCGGALCRPSRASHSLPHSSLAPSFTDQCKAISADYAW